MSSRAQPGASPEPNRPERSQSDPQLPAQIGAYQITDRLGGGAMAELFLARKVSALGFVRKAVVKRVKRSRPDYQQLQQMLIDEARATACLDHPNLVSLFDVGQSEDGVFLALEYVDGADLRHVNYKLQTRKEALPFELAVYITVEVLRGLHHAHTTRDEAGRPLEIIHRDVNPSNVLIARSGHVKLADFGVVRMRERVQQKTEPGLVKGKYAYLAPEYIGGEPSSIQTDIYAAGIMLFELLSGRECFTGKTAYEVMWKVVNKGVPMYRLEREGVPEDLQRIVERATASGAAQRYPNAQEMANALEAWLMRSGRHATAWVLAVFFERHDLYSASESSLDTWGKVKPSPPEPALDKLEPRARAPSDISKARGSLAPRAASEPGAGPPPDWRPPQTNFPVEPEPYLAFEPVEDTPPSVKTTIPTGGPLQIEFTPDIPAVPSETLVSTDAGRTEPETSSPAPLDPANPPRSGQLDTIPAAELLDCLLTGRFRGIVEFRCGVIWKKVSMYEGRPIGVTSNMGMELIGEHLVKSKTISRDQLNKALRRSEQDGRPLTTTLIEDGALARQALEIELGKNLGSRLNEVLEWRWGTFEVRHEEVPPAEYEPKLELAQLIEQARSNRAATPSTEDPSGGLDASQRLEQAVDIARRISSSSGRGKVERPWRSDDPAGPSR